MFVNACFVALGGALGAVGRYFVGILTSFVLKGFYVPGFFASFPLSTFLANVIGCFIIGFLSIFFENNTQAYAAHLKLFAVTGILGGFTTFSTFSLETVSLFQDGVYGLAFLNVLMTLVVCFAGVVLGRMAGQALFLKA